MKCQLKQILDERGLKQKWLYTKIGLSSSAMSQIVRGESLPTLPTALRIAKLLDVHVEDIWIEE